MADTYSDDSGDIYAPHQDMKVDGQPFDATNPDHRAALRAFSDEDWSLGDASNWKGDDDADVMTVTSPNGTVTTATSTGEQPAHIDIPGGGSVTAGSGTACYVDGDAETIRIRRR